MRVRENPNTGITAMVSVVGVIDEEGTVRKSLHVFHFDSEQQLNDWLLQAPQKKPPLFEGMPDTHVEIPK